MDRVRTGYSRRSTAQNAPRNRRFIAHDRVVGPLLLCVVLGLGVTVGQAQWLEKVIYLPDSLSGVVNPSCIAYSSLSNKVYVSGGIDVAGYPRAGPDCWVVVIDGGNDRRIKRIAVPTEVSALCYNAAGNKVYAVNYLDSVLSVIDAETDSVIAEAQLPCDPNFGLCWNGELNKVYLELNTDSAVVVIDGATDTVIKTIQTVPRASMLVCVPEHNKLYCGGRVATEVAAVDCTADTVCARIALPTMPTAMCYDAGGAKVFIASGRYVTCVDAASDTVVMSGAIATDNAIVALAYDSIRSRLWCALHDESVYVVDATTLAVVARLHIEGVGAKSVWLDASDDRVYCTSDCAGIVEIFDCATNSVVANLSVGERPVALCANAREGKVYCVSYEGDDVNVIAGDSIVACVAVGSQPVAFCYNPARNKVYCASYSNGLVSVIDGATNQVLANPRVGYRAYDLLYAPEVDKVYCTSGLEGYVSVIDCATDAVIARVRVDTLPHLVSYSPVQKRVYCSTAWPTPRLFIIDCATDSVRSIINLPGSPLSQCYHRLADKLYIGFDGYRDCGIHVFACGPDSLVDTVPGTGDYYCADIFSSPLYNKVYCGDGNRGIVAVVDAATDTILKTIKFPGFVRYFSGACFNPGRDGPDRLYLALESSPGTVLVLDAKTDSILNRVRGRYLFDVCYSAVNDMVYGSHFDSVINAVSVLDCATDEYVADVPVEGRIPTCIALNPLHGRIYVGNRLSGSVSVLRDSGGGVADAPRPYTRPRDLATVIRDVIYLRPASGSDQPLRSVLLDVAGREVLELRPGPNNVRSLAPGVYFLRIEDRVSIQKVVVTR